MSSWHSLKKFRVVFHIFASVSTMRGQGFIRLVDGVLLLVVVVVFIYYIRSSGSRPKKNSVNQNIRVNLLLCAREQTDL